MFRSASTPLIATLWPTDKTSAFIRNTVLLALGACLITLGAKIQVPFYPVPMTMQSFAVMLIGAAYGRTLGVAAVVAYLAAGFAGVPVFANTPPQVAGPLYFFGPTGGFLVGFIGLAWFSGLFANGLQTNWVKFALGAVLGHVALFGLGMAWMAYLLPAMRDMGVLYAKGLEPFLLASVFKMGLATALYVGLSYAADKKAS